MYENLVEIVLTYSTSVVQYEILNFNFANISEFVSESCLHHFK